MAKSTHMETDCVSSHLQKAFQRPFRVQKLEGAEIVSMCTGLRTQKSNLLPQPIKAPVRHNESKPSCNISLQWNALDTSHPFGTRFTKNANKLPGDFQQAPRMYPKESFTHFLENKTPGKLGRALRSVTYTTYDTNSRQTHLLKARKETLLSEKFSQNSNAHQESPGSTMKTKNAHAARQAFSNFPKHFWS